MLNFIIFNLLLYISLHFSFKCWREPPRLETKSGGRARLRNLGENLAAPTTQTQSGKRGREGGGRVALTTQTQSGCHHRHHRLRHMVSTCRLFFSCFFLLCAVQSRFVYHFFGGNSSKNAALCKARSSSLRSREGRSSKTHLYSQTSNWCSVI